MTAVSFAAPGARDFGRAVHAEWTKFRTVRSSPWTLLISTTLTIGTGAAFLPLRSHTFHGPDSQAAHIAAYEGWWYEGMNIGIMAVIILGVLVATAEYSTGTINATLTAVPSRTRALAAKATTLAAITLVTGAVQAAAVFLIGRPILSSRGIDISLTDPQALRGLMMAALAMMGAGLFGLAAGLMIRATAGAIGAVVTVWFVVSALAALLPHSWSGVAEALPADANAAMFNPHQGLLSPGPATAVFGSYVAALLAIAGTLFVHRDP
jgi:ABC-2 type transport system permease protein